MNVLPYNLMGFRLTEKPCFIFLTANCVTKSGLIAISCRLIIIVICLNDDSVIAFISSANAVDQQTLTLTSPNE